MSRAPELSCSRATTGTINPDSLASDTRMSLSSDLAKATGQSALQFGPVFGPHPHQHPLEICNLRTSTRIGSSKDLTLLQRVAEPVARSEAHLDQRRKLGRVASWAWNVLTGELFWSKVVFPMLGFDPDGTKPHYSMVVERVHPEDRSRADETWKRAAHEKADFALDVRFISPNGSVKYIHSEGHPVLNESDFA